MTLPLDTQLKIGIQTIHRRTEPATAPWRPTIDEMQALVRLVYQDRAAALTTPVPPGDYPSGNNIIGDFELSGRILTLASR